MPKERKQKTNKKKKNNSKNTDIKNKSFKNNINSSKDILQTVPINTDTHWTPDEPRKENIKNIPNFLTLIRIILSPVLVFLVFQDVDLWTITIVFAFAALTDAADGFIARKFKQETEFGRKFDIIADRLLMVSVVVALILFMRLHGTLDFGKVTLIGMIMAREIISAPFFIIATFFKRNPIPQVRWVGKITTILQGFTFPMIVLGWVLGTYLAYATLLCGGVSGLIYAYDSCFKKKIVKKEY